MDWQRAWENKDLVDYYRGLIALRMQLPGLQDKSAEAGKRILQSLDLANNCAGVLLDNQGANSKWKKLFVCFNCDTKTKEIALPAGKWQVLADGKNAFLWQADIRVAGKFVMPGKSALILGE